MTPRPAPIAIPAPPPIMIHWTIHLTGVAWAGGCSSCWRAVPEVDGRGPSLVPDRCRLYRLAGVAALACGFLVSGLWPGGGWRLGDGRFMCEGCGGRTSVTAGTVFDRTRTPLAVWFKARWLFATSRDGVSALSLQRTLEIGSYQTAWAMLHRLRAVLVRPDREQLSGTV